MKKHPQNIAYIFLFLLLATTNHTFAENPLTSYFNTLNPQKQSINHTRALSDTLEPLAFNPNQEAVASELIGVTVFSPALTTAFSTLETLSVEESNEVIDELQGQQYAGLYLIAQTASQQFFRNLYNPLRPIITNTNPEIDCRTGYSFDIWTEGLWRKAIFRGNGIGYGFDNSGHSASIGILTNPVPEYTFGIAASYGTAHSSYRLNGSENMHHFFGGMYGLYRSRVNYLLFNFVYGAFYDRLKRTIDIDTLEYQAHAKPQIRECAFYLEEGFDVDICPLSIQPFVGIGGNQYVCEKICESGAYPFNLRIKNRSRNVISSRLGTHITTLSSSTVSLSIDLAWQHIFSNLDNTIRPQFQSFGSPFKIRGVELARDSIDGTVNVGFQLWGFLDLSLNVSGQWAPSTYSCQTLFGVGIHL